MYYILITVMYVFYLIVSPYCMSHILPLLHMFYVAVNVDSSVPERVKHLGQYNTTLCGTFHILLL